MEKTDIATRADIDGLMQRFYAKAMIDDRIGYIFTDIAKLDLAQHLPIIGDFWETLLLGSGNYQRHGRNPMQEHAALDRKSPLFPAHFERWLEIFRGCVCELFAGPRADLIKLRAAAIAQRMIVFLRELPAAGVTAR